MKSPRPSTLHKTSRLFRHLPSTHTHYARTRFHPQHQHSFQQTRAFLPNPLSSLPNFSSLSSSPTQRLSASRILPYPHSPIYTIIADVNQYASFLPYCTGSTITKWSRPDRDGKRWPEEAELVVGWGGFEEKFTSRIYCVPGKIVEAIGGGARTRLGLDEIGHHSNVGGEGMGGKETANGSTGTDQGFGSNPASSKPSASPQRVLTHLLTRWTLRPFSHKSQLEAPSLRANIETIPKEHTEVSLAIEFRFANPLYSVMSAAMTEKIAAMMIEAFEKRVERMMERGG